MITQSKLDEWQRKERTLGYYEDTFWPVDIREMLGEIRRLREFESLAKETGIFG